MKSFKKSIFIALSCVLTVCFVVLFAACGGGGRTVNQNDKILGTWYAEVPDTANTANSKVWVEIVYDTSLATNGYVFYFKTRLWEKSDSYTGVSASNKHGKYLYLDLPNAQLKDNEYNLSWADKNVECKHLIISLSGDTFTVRGVETASWWDNVTFTRTTMTEAEFDAIDVTPEASN